MPALTETETTLLRMRFDDPRRVTTLREVASLLGMPLPSARRIERRALRKLRASVLGPIAQGFDGWDEA